MSGDDPFGALEPSNRPFSHEPVEDSERAERLSKLGDACGARARGMGRAVREGEEGSALGLSEEDIVEGASCDLV